MNSAGGAKRPYAIFFLHRGNIGIDKVYRENEESANEWLAIELLRYMWVAKMLKGAVVCLLQGKTIPLSARHSPRHESQFPTCVPSHA